MSDEQPEDLTIDLETLDDSLLQLLKEDDVQDSFTKGMDLRHYMEGGELDINVQLKLTQEELLGQFIAQAEDIVSLNSQITEFDNILRDVETMLSGFQSSLGTLSAEIKLLQESSLEMNVRIKNTREVEKEVSRYVDSIAVPPELISKLLEGDINDSYASYLVEFDAIKRFWESERESEKIQCLQDLEPVMVELTAQVVKRVRLFLLEHIVSLQTPKTNVQIKQTVMLKYRYLYEFLMEHERHVGMEVGDCYVQVLSKIYYHAFRKYYTEIFKLLRKDHVIDNLDLLGVNIADTGGLFTQRKTEQHVLSTFIIGKRYQAIQDMEEEVKFHVAFKTQSALLFEEIFGATLRQLMNSAISEFRFLMEFFGSKAFFGHIFARSISFILEQIENYLFTCYDSIGVLLMIRLLHRNQLVMLSSRVPCLDQFFDRLNILLWPKFKGLIDMNINSLRTYKMVSSSYNRAIDVVCRYAEFACSLLILNETYEDEIIENVLFVLRSSIDSVLRRCAQTFLQTKQQVIFLIINFDRILFTLKEKSGISKDRTHYEQQQYAQILLYIEEELHSFRVFLRVISFVKSCEAVLSEGKSASDEFSADSVGKISAEFRERWKEELREMSDNVLSDFNASLNRDEILKKVLREFIVYYQKFCDLISKNFQTERKYIGALVPLQNVLYEVKKLGNRS